MTIRFTKLADNDRAFGEVRSEVSSQKVPVGTNRRISIAAGRNLDRRGAGV